MDENSAKAAAAAAAREAAANADSSNAAGYQRTASNQPDDAGVVAEVMVASAASLPKASDLGLLSVHFHGGTV